MPPANGYNHAVVASGPPGAAAAHKLIGVPGRHLTPSVLSAVLVVIGSGRVRVAQRAQGAARRLGGGVKL
ncbi:hypothetical protein [Nonomuraea sp. NPDC003201]